MNGKVINFLAIVIWLFGLFTWYQIYLNFEEVYVRKTFHLPAIMTAAIAGVLFAGHFDEEVKGLGFYVKIFGAFVLLVTVYTATTIVRTNGL